MTAGAGRRLPAASRGTASDVVAVLSAGLMLALTAAAVAMMVAAGQTSRICGGRSCWRWGAPPGGLPLPAASPPIRSAGLLLLGFAVIDLVGGFTSGYALLCYRLGHSGLPLGRAAVVAEALSGTLTTVILPLVVLLFPDGRLPSRRWRWAIGAFIVFAGVVLAGQLAQAMSAVIGHPVQVGSSGSLVALNNPPRGRWEMALNGLAISAYLLVWLLVGLYAGLVLLATRVLSLHGTVAVAAATLAAAAAFSPVLRRVQIRVDRRFNRARYDADQTVAAFAARLKDTVDLNSAREDLAGVVHQALEPVHVSV